MIIKEREYPPYIQSLEALLRRIPPYHPKFPQIKESLSKNIAGYNGEKSVDYFLSLLNEKKYFIFHDLRLQVNNHFFQIDTLIATKNFILLLEVKNIAGTLIFDRRLHQLIRIQDGLEMAFPDPFNQVDRHEKHLIDWLALNHFPDIPILSLIILSHPQSIIRSIPETHNLYQKVIRRDYLPSKISQIEKQYQKEIYTNKEMKKLIRVLLKKHSPLSVNILERFYITKDDIIRGVHCTNCHHIPLGRRYGTWICSICNLESKDAHIASLKDYYYLFGASITNHEARNFLDIHNPSLVKRLLKSVSCTYSGTNKGRVYMLFQEK